MGKCQRVPGNKVVRKGGMRIAERRDHLLLLFRAFVAQQTVGPPQCVGIGKACTLATGMSIVILKRRGVRNGSRVVHARYSRGGSRPLQDLLQCLSKSGLDWVLVGVPVIEGR